MHNPFRSQFAFFEQSRHGVYLDSAATTQKLNSVLEATDSFARHANASVHRSAYTLANVATERFEEARSHIAQFIHAKSSREIVFTSGATESLNLISQGLSNDMLSGDTILICESEHHANILPWQALAKRLNLKIVVLKLGQNGSFDNDTLDLWLGHLHKDIAILACAHVSNVLGNIYPIQLLCKQAKALNILTLIDGTQAVAHLPVDVQRLGCDFYVFSGHKMYAPNGIGVCWGRLSLLDNLQATKLGGEMVTKVSFEHFETQAPPLKFEAGTANVSGVLGLGTACRFLSENLAAIYAYEQGLFKYFLDKIKAIPEIQPLGNSVAARLSNSETSIAVLSFYAPKLDNHSLAMHLYQHEVALRFGQHCAMPLLDALSLPACLRVSLGCYNNYQDIDYFIDALQQSIATLLAQSDEADEGTADTNSTEEAAELGELDWETKISQAKDWSEKHRQLLLLSKLLPILPSEQRNPSNAVAGCEASVWMQFDETSNGFLAYSDSKVVRGILAVLILKFEQVMLNGSKHSAVSFDYLSYLKTLGLSDYFSSGRKDGVRAVVQQMICAHS